MRILILSWALLVFVGSLERPGRAADSRPSSASPAKTAVPVKITALENTFRVTDTLYSGSQPESDAAFAALAKLGVKTIVSVDGSKPDVARAHRYGLQYVHLPVGYDGIPTNRVAELAGAVAIRPGPFYIHCHHGLHRGPAAVAAICESSGIWSPSQAVAWLHQAGTSEDYPGLYRAVREFRKPTGAELAAITDVPEMTRTTSLVEAMVAIDEHFSWLKECQKAGWLSPAGHPDISPKHEATQLWEQFRELPRLIDFAAHPEDFRKRLNEAERAADSLRILLSAPSKREDVDGAFKQSAQACSTCHKTYRN